MDLVDSLIITGGDQRGSGSRCQLQFHTRCKVAVFAPASDVAKAIAAAGPKTAKKVAIAAVNGPKMTVVSGQKDEASDQCTWVVP